MSLSSYLNSHSLGETFDELINRAIDLAIEEDLGSGVPIDITSNACVPETCRADAVVLVKEPAIVSGLDVFERVLRRIAFADVADGAGESRRARRLSCDLNLEFLLAEGEMVSECPQEIIRLSGPARSILAGERLALNLLQRMSGVATMTGKFVNKAKPLGIKILDTRKTTPCLRAFEKYAVVAGGGTNHRMGLFDNILIKDNHIRVAGSITQAMKTTRKLYPDKPVEVEATTLQEVQEALANNAETILLDNMTPEMVRQAVSVVAGRSKLEVSGGINQQNIDDYLIAGVDYISVGALTHSTRAVDISLEIVKMS